MSSTISKFVLRCEIPELVGKSLSETYDYFESILGEADDVYYYDDELDYFSYDCSVGDYCPVRCLDTGFYGVDFVININNSDYDAYNDINFSVLSDMIKDMCNTFKIDSNNVSVVSYSWYTGVDEPIHIYSK